MLDQNPAAQAWLSQFSAVDQQVGRQFLRSLRLISTSDFERDLDETLAALMDDLGDQMVSLFSVPELVSEALQNRAPGRPPRQAGSSSDRIRHYLETFAR